MKKALVFSIFASMLPVACSAVVIHTAPPQDAPRHEVREQRKTTVVTRQAPAPERKTVVVRRPGTHENRTVVVERPAPRPAPTRTTTVVVKKQAQPKRIVKRKTYIKRYAKPAPHVREERVVVRRVPAEPVRVYEYYEETPVRYRRVYTERYYEPRYAVAPVSFSLGFVL